MNSATIRYNVAAVTANIYTVIWLNDDFDVNDDDLHTHLNSVVGDVLGRCAVSALDSRRDHVWFEQNTFKEDVMVRQRLEHERQDLLGDAARSFDVVVAVWKYFRFHDRYQTILRRTTV